MAYIDGYNVYHGLIYKGWRHLLWLDYAGLLSSRLNDGQIMQAVKYFTSRGRGPDVSDQRQGTYLDALECHGGIEIHDGGGWSKRPAKCRHCGNSWDRPKEKKTDVAIAVEMVSDAYEDRYDVAFLMSADSDMVPAVEHVINVHGKAVINLVPRGRRSDDLISAVTGVRHIQKSLLNRYQLPDTLSTEDGRTLSRPLEWTQN